MGGVKTARSYARRINGDLVLVDKRRPEHNVAVIMTLSAKVNGKNVLIVDDMIDTATTFVKCAEALKEKGALEIIGVAVHPVFSGMLLKKSKNAMQYKSVCYRYYSAKRVI